ncbi:PREDICTED: uncharacterized protein LOC18595768 isoform X2 [Theobroma cacao]|uniref:Uncharacterized protein LOC18595768 isoform X2 n=1 Tax=Theobroma cacao TaxID=3641 RepID=A0AB32X2I6_THECC|nr:PREDICTED: uncharacterized protein LOC18595768 isoform X2 [Theobroma cacao]
MLNFYELKALQLKLNSYSFENCLSKPGSRLRAMRVRLAKKRRAIRRMRQSLSALQIAAEQIDRRNERIIAENALIDQLVYDLLAEIENDPLIRAQNLDGRNIITNQAPPPRGGADDGRKWCVGGLYYARGGGGA